MSEYFKMAIYPILSRAVQESVGLTKEELAVIDDWYNDEKDNIVKGCKVWYDHAFFVNHIKYFNERVQTVNSVLKHRGHEPYPILKFKVQLDESKG